MRDEIYRQCCAKLREIVTNDRHGAGGSLPPRAELFSPRADVVDLTANIIRSDLETVRYMPGDDVMEKA